MTWASISVLGVEVAVGSEYICVAGLLVLDGIGLLEPAIQGERLET